MSGLKLEGFLDPRLFSFCSVRSILVAFVLEAFVMEYSLEKSDLQTSVETKIQELQLSLEPYVPAAGGGVSACPAPPG